MLSKFSIINIHRLRKKVKEDVGSLYFSILSDLNWQPMIIIKIISRINYKM